MKVFRIIPEFMTSRLSFHRMERQLKHFIVLSFFHLFSVYLKIVDHLNLKVLIITGADPGFVEKGFICIRGGFALLI